LPGAGLRRRAARLPARAALPGGAPGLRHPAAELHAAGLPGAAAGLLAAGRGLWRAAPAGLPQPGLRAAGLPGAPPAPVRRLRPGAAGRAAAARGRATSRRAAARRLLRLPPAAVGRGPAAAAADGHWHEGAGGRI
ncbi:unnamed protein product, partial [Prorocentrum cordatum]